MSVGANPDRRILMGFMENPARQNLPLVSRHTPLPIRGEELQATPIKDGKQRSVKPLGNEISRAFKRFWQIDKTISKSHTSPIGGF